MLAGKVGVVFGAANKRSIAWGVVEAWVSAGARVHVVCQSERFVKGLEGLAVALDPSSASSGGSGGSGGGGIAGIHVCDVASDDAILAFFEALAEDGVSIARASKREPLLDCVLHSIAHAPTAAMKGTLLETTRADFASAHDVSAYSLIAIARAAKPLMIARPQAAEPVNTPNNSRGVGAEATTPENAEAWRFGGSITALSFQGSSRAAPGYNVMGCAKASLEAAARGLALELGPPAAGAVRVNVLSPGPVSTLASRGVRSFVELKAAGLARAPLRRTASAREVGAAAAFLASDGAASVTGQVWCLDGGASAVMV